MRFGRDFGHLFPIMKLIGTPKTPAKPESGARLYAVYADFHARAMLRLASTRTSLLFRVLRRRLRVKAANVRNVCASTRGAFAFAFQGDLSADNAARVEIPSRRLFVSQRGVFGLILQLHVLQASTRKLYPLEV